MEDKARKRYERELDKKLKKSKKEQERREFKLKLSQSLGIDVDKRNKKYPIVEDYDELTQEITGFRKGHDEYFRKPGILENSEMQKHSTQAYWHVCYLQKARMNKLGITMETKSDRRDFRGGKSRLYSKPVHEDKSSDGRYEINNVREEITATRKYLKNGQTIGKFEFENIASYFVLSAQSVGNNKIVCPNCGSATTKEDLIDGCDYCGTKFTIEDIQDKFGHFSFREDKGIQEMKEKGSEIYDENQYSEHNLDKYFYEKYGKEIRELDPNFSLFDFMTNVHNKIAMIHYADRQSQVNAFSDINLEEAIDMYKNIVNLDISKTSIDMYSNKYPAFEVKDGLQYIRTSSHMYVYELVDGKIERKLENVNIEVAKSAERMTESVHSPSIMKCKGCGTSLSLLEGKACPMCGREINLIDHDWIITGYRISTGSERKEFSDK